jgi:hypothetical protein
MGRMKFLIGMIMKLPFGLAKGTENFNDLQYYIHEQLQLLSFEISSLRFYLKNNDITQYKKT